MGARSVQSLLEDIRLLGEGPFEIVEAVRALVRSRFPEVSEAVKYGGILFSADVMFAGVFAYKAHVSVEFSHGAQVKDDWGHLEGGGKYRRHLKLRELADIDTLRLSDYLPLALRAAQGHG